MKIYTKTGDAGTTSMLGGARVCKSCLEMESIGEVDETNSFLGLLIARLADIEKFKKEKEKLVGIQHNLFVIGASLAAVQMETKEIKKLGNKEIVKLEKWIDAMEKDLLELKNFILPGGSKNSAVAFIVRTVCRRAERQVIALSKKYKLDQNIIKYLNRLSDLLFVLARWINLKSGVEEVRWKR